MDKTFSRNDVLKIIGDRPYHPCLDCARSSITCEHIWQTDPINLYGSWYFRCNYDPLKKGKIMDQTSLIVPMEENIEYLVRVKSGKPPKWCPGKIERPVDKVTPTITKSGEIVGYMSNAEAAEFFNVKKDTIRMWVQRGKIKFPDHIQIGHGEYFIRRGIKYPDRKQHKKRGKMSSFIASNGSLNI